MIIRSDVIVDSEYQGRGIGRKLVDACIQRLKEARKLYEKCGFTDCARYNDNAYADVFMKLELKKES